MVATPELRLAVEEQRSAVSVLMLWVGRAAVALAFVFIGASKFPNSPRNMWVTLFEQIGFGQWFRYFTGIVQIAGGLLLLNRRTITAGAALLICTMIGAAIVDVVVMRSPGYVLAPLSLLGMIAAIWFATLFGAGARRT
jgi:uncharacterized membrane protein YphA (DoxX/SURF4 family)